MIKNFGEYINESMNPLNKGDVIEVVSIYGQIEDLPENTAKYIGRIYIVDSSTKDKVTTLDGGSWSIQDVRKLSAEEVKKRQPEIKEIIDAWEKKKEEYKNNSIKRLEQSISNTHKDLNYIDEDIEISKEVSSDKGNKYKVTLKIEKL